MEKTNFLGKLAEVLELEREQVTEDLALDGGLWDSLAIIGTIAAIDEEFEITVDPKALGDCGSVQELLSLIEQTRQQDTTDH